MTRLNLLLDIPKQPAVNVYQKNIGQANALKVFTVTKMRFVTTGDTISGLRNAEQVLFDEIRKEMKSATEKITTNMPPDSEQWFTIKGPILSDSDLHRVKGSNVMEISRSGSALMFGSITEYADSNGNIYTSDFCHFLGAKNVSVNCLGSHNIEN